MLPASMSWALVSSEVQSSESLCSDITLGVLQMRVCIWASGSPCHSFLEEGQSQLPACLFFWRVCSEFCTLVQTSNFLCCYNQSCRSLDHLHPMTAGSSLPPDRSCISQLPTSQARKTQNHLDLSTSTLNCPSLLPPWGTGTSYDIHLLIICYKSVLPKPQGSAGWQVRGRHWRLLELEVKALCLQPG